MKVLKAKYKKGKLRVAVRIRNQAELNSLMTGKSGVLVRLFSTGKVAVGLYPFPESKDVLA